MKKTIFYDNTFIKDLFEKEFSNELKEVLFINGTTQNKLSKKILDETNILIIHVSSIVNQEVINKFKNLKMIATYSTGLDHIDLEYAQSKSILVKNVPAYGSRSVAEHALALLFNISQKINLSVKYLKEDQSFLVKKRNEIRGFKLEDKKIGIIGVGRIGKEMIKISRALGLNVLAFDVFKDEKFAKKYNFKYVTLKSLLKNSDIISLHLPLFKETYHFLGKKEFSQMKNSVVIINTARGALINGNIFLKNLKSKKVLEAGLDVLENEGAIFNKKFENLKEEKIAKINREILKQDNVTVTPHNAYNTDSAILTVVQETVKHIKQFEKSS